MENSIERSLEEFRKFDTELNYFISVANRCINGLDYNSLLKKSCEWTDQAKEYIEMKTNMGLIEQCKNGVYSLDHYKLLEKRKIINKKLIGTIKKE